MNSSPRPPLPVFAPTGSERFRLARLARDVARSTPGVVGLDAGRDGLHASSEGEERIDGVLATAAREGGYVLELQLVCGVVPLIELCERVRRDLTEAASRQGLAVRSVDVRVVAVAEPGEA